MLRTSLIFLIDSSGNRRRSVIVEVVVQRTITRTKLLLLQEKWVVEQRECVEDVKFSLLASVHG